MRKSHWREHNERLDPETDYVEIYRTVATHEFPWDLNQALSFALFRTYAVPSIGRLLDETGELTGAAQKRYDDTVLLLEAPLTKGFDSIEGRTATRRINQMHARYDISNDDMRYVLATFVVVPKRWLDDYGWRPLTRTEVDASVAYYRQLGRRMDIKDLPSTYAGFAELMDAYEREHFAFDVGARRVADATLALLSSFYPKPAARLVDLSSRALMDEALLRALAYDEPSPAVRRVSAGALRARARLLRVLPPRRRPRTTFDSPRIRSYSAFPDLASMGTFASPAGAGCPVRATPASVPAAHQDAPTRGRARGPRRA